MTFGEIKDALEDTVQPAFDVFFWVAARSS